VAVRPEGQPTRPARRGRGLVRRPAQPPGRRGRHHRCRPRPHRSNALRSTRRHRVSHDIGWLLSDRRHPDEAGLPGLAAIAEVEATVTRGRRTSTTRRLHLPSARLDAAAFARAVRARWAIENGLHWVLDVGFDEDRARNRKDNGPENLSILRKLALNLLRAARPDISIRRERKRSGWSDDFARSIIGHMR
jgi:predicted transposase YbfD/YdcC